ncbi:MFS transporter [Phyllobacterium myrsinacearum]|uniref:MFS family permease n=1 Tax=Phyllobacterium myrsinacearum TaxID=28101 RepID=A0A839ENA7_9HYPH|nr:MFS transporter [Phyllobacterium myrsinacearum]MBA8878140.1 MFS family permease [Phyllobacterium myrsinacearum]
MTAHTRPHSTAEKLMILAAVCLAALAMPISFTGPAVALPSIARALGGSPVELNWITNAFMLAFGSSLMAAGALADNYGRKRIFLTGLVLFAVFSLALSLVTNLIWFDILRAAQGLASALAFSGGMAALAQEFDRHERTRAFSLIGITFGIGLSFGPILSGFLISHFGWQAAILVTVPITVVAFCLGAFRLRESRDPDALGIDWPGAMSFTLALTLLTCGILQAPDIGWGHPLVVGMLVAALVVFGLFAVIEHCVARPMLDLSLFRYPRFVGVQLLAAAPAYSFVVLLILLPIRYIGVEDFSEVQTGQMMIALSSPLLIVPFLAALLTRWFSAAVLCSVGLLLSAAGLFWLSRCMPGQPVELTVPALMLIGFGISLPWGLMDGLAVSVVPKERAGMATGIFSTTRIAGEGIALAVVSALFTALLSWKLGAVLPVGVETAQAAQKIATGNLASAMSLLAPVTREAVLQSYGDAFSHLLQILAEITVVTAFAIFIVMRIPDRETATA